MNSKNKNFFHVIGDEIKCNDFGLDKVFGEKLDYINYVFDAYRKIYDLPTIKYTGRVSEELFKYIKKRKYFILLSIYDENGKIYLERNIQDKIYWSLPGGSVHYGEDFFSTVFKDRIWVFGGMDVNWEWRDDVWASEITLQ